MKISKNLSCQHFEVDNRLVVKLGRGDKTLFWLDKWAGNQPLKDVFPGLFTVETYKFCIVLQRYSIMDGIITWSWGGSHQLNRACVLRDWEACTLRLKGQNPGKDADS
ncbi:hypothetical protein HanRHA438_Chr17g0790531 [Helianthus annuus]|nr:hypothetical protein HanRHA438_Chr17g0790531 [Helianthus annuus]